MAGFQTPHSSYDLLPFNISLSQIEAGPSKHCALERRPVSSSPCLLVTCLAPVQRQSLAFIEFYSMVLYIVCPIQSSQQCRERSYPSQIPHAMTAPAESLVTPPHSVNPKVLPMTYTGPHEPAAVPSMCWLLFCSGACFRIVASAGKTNTPILSSGHLLPVSV